MAQFNMPYPSTAYLTSYLLSVGHSAMQRDWSVELLRKLLSKEGLTRIKQVLLNRPKKNRTDAVNFFLDCFVDYKQTIESVVHFLQGKDPSLALRLAARNFVPEGPRFLVLDQNEKNDLMHLFGSMGIQDKAKYMASLYIDDIADVIREGIDQDFAFARYGENLASSMTSFAPLFEKLKNKTVVDEILEEIVREDLKTCTPEVLGLSVPFPGNVLGALRIGALVKKEFPLIKIILGGGYVNTELRQMEDVRPFSFFDYLVFDDGERPLEKLLGHFQGNLPAKDLLRTWYFDQGKIIRVNMDGKSDLLFKHHPGPTFQGLPIPHYMSMCEMPNPMHRLWSDFRWNKMMLAHGCYWKKCTFCDVSLAYIERFEPANAERLVDQMERIMNETGQSGFHFVDEAAPPALLKALCTEILRRGLKVTWWGNLRFDPQFTLEMCELMADAGCVAVTGGVEVASERILEMINKGITLEQVACVSKNFSMAKIYVHAYLMYGFPTQTEQETIDSLEVVRQLFKHQYIQSAHWHRFACTAHSPVGKSPDKFGIQLLPVRHPKQGLFAFNEIPFQDDTGIDHGRAGEGLRLALYNYMLGIGLDFDVREWFEDKMPKTTLPKNWLKSL
ncbi:MAG: radical SAM protein [Bdellovibrio sp.]|nr:radical SAM protein [Bdellovibrio sp.]